MSVPFPLAGMAMAAPSNVSCSVTCLLLSDVNAQRARRSPAVLFDERLRRP